MAHNSKLVQLLAMLSAVAVAGASDLHIAAHSGDAALVAQLLEGGASANEVHDGATALHISAAEGHADVAKALLAAGAKTKTLHEQMDMTALQV